MNRLADHRENWPALPAEDVLRLFEFVRDRLE